MTTGLPIEDVIGDVLEALAGPGVGVLVASPGAGKTTIVPLRLLDAPWRGDGRILVLEPRRIAARAAARRMASLRGEQAGDTVGFVTRDDRAISGATRVEVITDGILTRRLQHDPELSGVSAVVFDEFHERRIQSDLGLALTLDVRRSLRPDLRVLVMSATIDAERIASMIGDRTPAPIIESEGRLHDVEVRWRPTDLVVGRRRGRALASPTVAAVTEALTTGDGDVLTFLPGVGEITATAEGLRSRIAADVDVHFLHGSLPAAQQDAALAPAPAGRRKIVLATDLAETSLTVEGVSSIVDAGMQRRPSFDVRSGLTRLVTIAGSKASATQRAGRAGRLGPGLAIRLWSESEHAGRDAHNAPEIAQVDVAGLLLEVLVWGAQVDELALVDPPSEASHREAMKRLSMLGALDGSGRLTPSGRLMATLPLQPRTAALVLAAAPEAAAIATRLAALLEEGDVLRARSGATESDVELRLALIADRRRRHPDASGRRLELVRKRARELERRLPRDRPTGSAASAATVLAAGYPDRIAQRRPGQRGRFLLQNGAGASVDEFDPIADAEFCVVADLDAADGDARIRMAAAMSEADVLAQCGSAIEEVEALVWDTDRSDLFVRTERRLGAITLASADRRAEPGLATTAALADAIGVHGIELLAPSDAAGRLQQRLGFLHEAIGADWPDVSDEAIVERRDAWLPVVAPGARRRGDLEKIDLRLVLRSLLEPHHHAQLERMAPDSITLPSGRRAPIGYGSDHGPTVRARVQEVYGLRENPTVANGSVSVLFDLRSPANRTVQLTSDLAGFWAGSWHDVRKEMAGRYPKHDWPVDPSR